MTLTPKEKALELLQKFGWLGRKWVQTNYTTLHFENAKQCAIVCINEILETYKTKDLIYPIEHNYWIEVKTEIENYTL